MHTDLPMPVAPAISKCGIFLISIIMGSPATLRPRHVVMRLLLFLNSSVEMSERRYTVSGCLLGTSIPTAALPGIGASMRTPPVARLRAISSTRFAIERTRMPASGKSSYRVIVGPRDTPTMRVFTLKLARTFTSFAALSCSSSRMLSFFCGPTSASRSIGGNLYSGFGISMGTCVTRTGLSLMLSRCTLSGCAPSPDSPLPFPRYASAMRSISSAPSGSADAAASPAPDTASFAALCGYMPCAALPSAKSAFSASSSARLFVSFARRITSSYMTPFSRSRFSSSVSSASPLASVSAGYSSSSGTSVSK